MAGSPATLAVAKKIRKQAVSAAKLPPMLARPLPDQILRR